MEWVETTAKTVPEAKDAALDRLGVASDEAEFEILEEPKSGLFGRMRGQARVRARVRPAPVRPKQERRRRGSGRRDDRAKSESPDSATAGAGSASAANAAGSDAPPSAVARGASAAASTASPTSTDDAEDDGDSTADPGQRRRRGGSGRSDRERGQDGPPSDGDAPGESADGTDRDAGTKVSTSTANGDDAQASRRRSAKKEQPMSDEELSTVTPEEVGAAAHAFVGGLVQAFGASGSTSVEVDGIEIAVTVDGDDLGRLVGPKGRTLVAVQDLARVASQRRLGDHETRLKVDVGGYRERRQEALVRFTKSVAQTVRDSGEPRSLEPMNSADRKVVHDVLNEEPGVSSRSEGEDPDRRVVIVPA